MTHVIPNSLGYVTSDDQITRFNAFRAVDLLAATLGYLEGILLLTDSQANERVGFAPAIVFAGGPVVGPIGAAAFQLRLEGVDNVGSRPCRSVLVLKSSKVFFLSFILQV